MSARDRLRRSDERFAVVAADLEARDWAAPSLCHAWTNHEVLAHLVIGYRCGLGQMVTGMLGHGGSFDHANAAMARALAATHGPATLLDEFVRLVHRPRGLGRIFPPQLLLGDHVTHELDILFAVDRDPAVSADALVAVLNAQVCLPNPFVPAFRNSRGLRLRATDVGWTHGDGGPVVQGAAPDLVSVLGNRPRRLHALTGAGVDVLAARLSRHPIRTVG